MPAGPFRFSWAGGVIQEPVTDVTSGNTHGGVLESASIVGDLVAGSAQLTHIASTTGLEQGALYTITGPGLVDGTFFVYDTSILVGAKGSLNLSDAATATIKAGTYLATKAIAVGTVAGSLTQGLNTVLLGDVDLPEGTYSIYGTGIGETVSPDDGGVMLVSSAWFNYDGSSGAADLYIHAAIADDDGIYTVAPQEVTATTTGTFSLGITGAPDADWYSVTSIPASALSGLVTGLRYNISGNGIQVGSTFLAPASGATAIELDLPASSSTLGAILTITGPRTPDAGFDPVLHDREDEQIVGLELSQDEGDFATLTIDVRNPNVGLLALGRNLWCWLSWDRAWTPEGGGGDLVPLFNGRLVGVPRLQAGEIVSLQFLARPDDFNAQKSDLVAALSVLPYYDPVWLAANVNPDTVLEAYSALWHVDRTTLELTTSDILQGEDGTITIGEDQAFYDAFSLAYGSPPITAVTVSGTVSWQQQGTGSLDITQEIVNGFAKVGSPYKSAFGLYQANADPIGEPGFVKASGGGLITCVCGDGMRTDWPSPGTSIGGGWSLSSDNEGTGVPLCYIISATYPEGWMEPNKLYVSQSRQRTVTTTPDTTRDEADVAVYTEQWGTAWVSFPINIYKTRMVLDWRADRTRTETVTAVLAGAVQRELSDSADSDAEDIALTSEYVAKGVDLGGLVPIGALTRRSYFQTDRGTSSFEYLLLAARAKLRSRARAADITFGVDWVTALTITLRNSVTYLDRRLPGGTATGKVKSYKLTVGDAGMFGEFTIGCSVGTGDHSTAAVGEPSYVDAEYVDLGWQVVSGSQTVLLDDELAYQSLDQFAVTDDGLDLTNLTVDAALNEFVVVNGLTEQMETLAAFDSTVAPTDGDAITEMVKMATACTLDMKPVTGASFTTYFFPSITPLAIPKTIDLSAASGR